MQRQTFLCTLVLNLAWRTTCSLKLSLILIALAFAPKAERAFDTHAMKSEDDAKKIWCLCAPICKRIRRRHAGTGEFHGVVEDERVHFCPKKAQYRQPCHVDTSPERDGDHYITRCKTYCRNARGKTHPHRPVQKQWIVLACELVHFLHHERPRKAISWRYQRIWISLAVGQFNKQATKCEKAVKHNYENVQWPCNQWHRCPCLPV